MNLFYVALFIGSAYGACNPDCLDSSQVPSAFLYFYETGDPCFTMNYDTISGTHCFKEFEGDSTGYLAACDCAEADCGCACASVGTDCLSSEALPSWAVGMLEAGNGDPCFEYSGIDSCFIHVSITGGNIGPCNCNVNNCGCGTPPSASGSGDSGSGDSGSGDSGSGDSGSGDSGSGDSGSGDSGSGDSGSSDCSADQAKYCASQYQRTKGGVTYDNTMCTYCGVDTAECNTVHFRDLSESDKTAIVEKHNELRADVANGRVTGQPTATDMYALTWDDELARVAQMWADQCKEGHDKSRIIDGYLNFPYVGQNVASSWSSAASNENSKPLNSMIMGWYNEVNDWAGSNVDPWSTTSPTDVSSKVTGHYTQLAWGATKKVGCGFIAHHDDTPSMAQYPNKQMLVCNYGPGGNGQTEPTPTIPMYTIGTTGKDCPTKLDSGLCSD